MFRLSDVIQPLSESQIEALTSKAIKRILHSEKAIAQSGMSHVSEPASGVKRSHFAWLKYNIIKVLYSSSSIILLKVRTSLKYVLQVRVKLLTRLVTQFDGMMKDDVLKFVLEDIRARSDLAFSLLYQEYNTYLSQLPSGLLDSYDHCLYTLLSGLQEKPEQKDG